MHGLCRLFAPAGVNLQIQNIYPTAGGDDFVGARHGLDFIHVRGPLPEL